MSDDPQTEPNQRSSGLKKTALVGGGIVLAAGAAFAMGANRGDVAWSDSDYKSEAATPAAAAAPVAPPVVAAPTMNPANAIRGVIKSKNESTIASRMTARITSMPYRTGQSFGRGALLARFDCSTIQAELNAAKAATQAYKKTYDTNVELDQYEAIGKNDVAVSKANLGKASAEANAVAAQLTDCAVYAPFSGTVVEQIAHNGEVAASGQPLMKIQSGGNVEVEVIVPSRWLSWMRPGETFSFKIDETGDIVQGRVSRLGASVDPVSKTIRITGNISGATRLVLPGMSGSADFPQAMTKGVAAAAPQQVPGGNPT
jgi:membrane fusion protein, multidrug efflux system